MAIRSVVTRGYGSGGSIALVILRGYATNDVVLSASAAPPECTGYFEPEDVTAEFPPEYWKAKVRPMR